MTSLAQLITHFGILTSDGANASSATARRQSKRPCKTILILAKFDYVWVEI
jgi:hypothetical protein